MVKRVGILAIFVIVFLVGFFVRGITRVSGQSKAMGSSWAAVPSEKGGSDQLGPYEVVPDWPKPMSTLPGHDKWGYGAVQYVFAQNQNRVFILQRGELPDIPRPRTRWPRVRPRPRWRRRSRATSRRSRRRRPR